MNELLKEELSANLDARLAEPDTEAATDPVIDACCKQAAAREGVLGSPESSAPPIPRSHFSPLFPDEELRSFRASWDRVQLSFVDDPRTAVEQADSLVANLIARVAEQFSSERQKLEKLWDRGENVDTEALRQTIKRYRGFFGRLLSF